MRTEQTRHRARSAFASSHARRRGIRSVLAGVRAVIVASAATFAPVAHGTGLQAQGASQAAPAVDSAVAARAGLIRLDWAGGTLQDFVKAVQATAPQQPVNVVLLDDGAERGSVTSVRIPPISVRDVTPTALFRSLVHLAPEGSELIVTVTGDMAAAAGDAEPGAHDAGRATGAPIITIRARRAVSAAEAAAKAAQPSVVVIDLSVYLLSADGGNIEGGPAKERLDRLMDAVGAALTLDDRPVVAAQLRIHAPTGLLFVKGDEGQVSLVNEVINCIVGQ